MQWWYVFDWKDNTTIRVVATGGFVPYNVHGPATMVNATTPVPEQALTTQVVNGVVQVLVDQAKLAQLFPNLIGQLFPGIKLF